MRQKLLFTLVAMFALILQIDAQEVPAAVLNTFNKMFPAAQDTEWEMDDEAWEVEFEMGDDMEFEATFAPDGSWLETEKEIRTSDVPQQVLSAIAKYPGYKMIGATESEAAEKGITYELVMKHNDNVVQLVIDPQGTVLETESVKEDDDDDDDDDEDDDEGNGN